MHGSVFPFSVMVALPCALISLGLKLMSNHVLNSGEFIEWLGNGSTGSNGIEGAAFTGINFMLGFLIVFRTSQAYTRFWEGWTTSEQMRADWFDAISSLIAFCKMSSADQSRIALFQHTLVRLFSMLHASALMELSKGFESDKLVEADETFAYALELIDAEGIDPESLSYYNTSEHKVQLLFQWIQQLIVEAQAKSLFSVPAPILTRAFQELASGMVRYHDALRITRVPFPFPYMQSTELLLLLHWCVTPVLMCHWTSSPAWTFVLCFVQILIFWSLNSIATELENPFGDDVNDLPAQETQEEMNQSLLMLLRNGTLRTPSLSAEAASDGCVTFQRLSCSSRGSMNMGQHGIRVRPLSAGEEKGPPTCRRPALETKTTLGAIKTSMSGHISERFSADERLEFDGRDASSRASRIKPLPWLSSRGWNSDTSVGELPVPRESSCSTTETVPEEAVRGSENCVDEERDTLSALPRDSSGSRAKGRIDMSDIVLCENQENGAAGPAPLVPIVASTEDGRTPGEYFGLAL